MTDSWQLETTEDSAADALAMLVHDLRTPLTALTQALQLMQNGRTGELTALQARFLSMGLDNAKTLARLLDTLLLPGSPGGALDVQFARFPAMAPALFVVEALQGTAESRNIVLTLDAYAPTCEAWGDQGLARRALLNLVGNALKYAHEGGRVTVHVETARDARFAVLRVSDDGPGIPPDEHELIFERHYRARDGKPRCEGSGLGLAIVREIAQAHGGRASVHLNEGGGCSFSVTLPRFGAGCVVESQLRRSVRELAGRPARLACLEARQGMAGELADQLVQNLSATGHIVLDMGAHCVGLVSPRDCELTVENILEGLRESALMVERASLVDVGATGVAQALATAREQLSNTMPLAAGCGA